MNFDFKRLFEKRPTLYYTESADISRKRWSEQMNMENLIGETTEYDKKAALEVRKPKSWCKSVSAFANTLGGALIFGMADGQIVGLTEPDSDAEKISEIIKTRMEPIPEFRLRFHRTEDGKVLLILDVFKGEETPYYYSGDGTLEAFVRIGNESVRASATELKRLVLRGRNASYDSQVTLYRVEDYAFSKLRERHKKWTGNSFDNKDLGQHRTIPAIRLSTAPAAAAQHLRCQMLANTQSIACAFGLAAAAPRSPYRHLELCGIALVSFGLADEGGFLTNAGALIADESPIRWSRLFCTRWNGLDKSGGTMDALDDAEYSGSVLSLIENGEAFIKRNARMMWRKTPNSREELPEYVERSYHEALVNALAHRDYLVYGSEVHIDIYDDRSRDLLAGRYAGRVDDPRPRPADRAVHSAQPGAGRCVQPSGLHGAQGQRLWENSERLQERKSTTPRISAPHSVLTDTSLRSSCRT